MNLITKAIGLCLLVLSTQSVLHSQESDESKVDFARDVLPILSDKCFVCHGPDDHSDTDLKLDSEEGATLDLGGYRAVDQKNPKNSELLGRIMDADDPMPPADADKQLTDVEKEILSNWVMQGGQYAKHWAFVVPKKSGQNIGANPIDHFVGKQLEAANIDFAAEPDKATLARRAALVLTGLPPEPDQLKRYMANQDQRAYEVLVDELLQSPRFGEHQARYWLDAVRYGDTHGLHLDNRRGIYPYRDWVVKAFNDNLSFDKFVTWQLAGDLLPEPTLAQKTATGFVRMNPTTGEGGAIPEEFQAKNNFDRTETFGTVFLGLSLNCARCHTHKYDPIQQKEYYSLLAFFNNTAEHSMDRNQYTYGNHIRVPEDQSAWEYWEQLEQARTKLLEGAREQVDRLPEEAQQLWNKADNKTRIEWLADQNREFSGTDTSLIAKAIVSSIKKAESSFTTTLVAEELGKPRETRLLKRGEYNLPQGDPIQPDVIQAVSGMPNDAPANRLGLAQWLLSNDNPLTSRVLVNQVWQRVFGIGLVRTPEDFGVQGQQSTHPELLDWLAVDFRESGWDHKALIRQMVLSKTFRQNSAWRSEIDDPENRLFARGPSYRLDAEVLRDMGLWASNLLDPTMGGEGVKPYQPSGMWLAMAHPASNTKSYVRDQGSRLYRRSLYVYWKRTSPHPMMTLFDAPSRESSCVRREPTNTSLQSLAMLNEIQRVEMAKMLAQRLVKEAKTDDERLNRLFMLIACRKANDKERDVIIQLLNQMKEKYSADKNSAQELLGYGDAQIDKKLDSIELAAWTQVTSTILASDIAILLY